jgi:hypothetical protein
VPAQQARERFLVAAGHEAPQQFAIRSLRAARRQAVEVGKDQVRSRLAHGRSPVRVFSFIIPRRAPAGSGFLRANTTGGAIMVSVDDVGYVEEQDPPGGSP